MLPRVFDIVFDILRFGSVSIFLGVVSSFVYLLLISKERREVCLSKPVVRRFVEYFGNVSLSDEGPAARHEQGGCKVAGRA